MLGIPNSSPFYQRQAECGYREGAGAGERRAVITVAGRAAAGLGCAWLGRLTMRRGGVGLGADWSNRQSQVVEGRYSCVAMGVACKQQIAQ